MNLIIGDSQDGRCPDRPEDLQGKGKNKCRLVQCSGHTARQRWSPSTI